MRNLISFFLILIPQIAIASEQCFQVVLQETVTELTCGNVKANVSAIDCQLMTIKKDYGSHIGMVSCQGPKTLKMTVDKFNLVSELKPNTLWGEKNLTVGETKIIPKEKSVLPKKRAVAAETKLAPPPQLQPSNKVAIAQAPIQEKNTAKEEPKAQETELKLKFSGFAWAEIENSKNFGYTIPGQYNDSYIFSDLQFEVSKDSTQAVYVLEANEAFSGDSQTGGQQGGRTNAIKTRNLYLSHDFDDSLNLKVGLQSIAADPNGYILSDNYSAAVLSYKASFGLLTAWTAQAFKDKPGLATTSSQHVNPDSYLGLKYQLGDENWDSQFYFVQRNNRESLYDSVSSSSVEGKSNTQWLGLTVGSNLSSVFRWQGTAIYNSGSFRSDVNDAKDTFNSRLLDLRIIASLQESAVDIQLEGLQTSGSNNSVDSGQSVQTIGKRSNFVSPDPGAAYLMTIVTSDGADDAPGSTKQSITGNLSQAEGLSIAVLKISKTFDDKLSAFVRYGLIRSTTKNLATDSSDMGNETDIGLNYAINKSTSFQIDYGFYKPGNYTTTTDAAELFVSRMKFSF